LISILIRKSSITKEFDHLSNRSKKMSLLIQKMFKKIIGCSAHLRQIGHCDND
jgi:hypothetical protein